MHTYYELKDKLHRELEEICKQGEVNKGNLDIIDTLLNSIKNADKIIMYEEYAEDGYSYDDGYSNARGRRGNVKRDSMGRYARSDGYSRNDGYSNRSRYSRDSGYSYDDGEKEEKVQMLKEMMNDARTEQEKSMLRTLITQMQN